MKALIERGKEDIYLIKKRSNKRPDMDTSGDTRFVWWDSDECKKQNVQEQFTHTKKEKTGPHPLLPSWCQTTQEGMTYGIKRVNKVLWEGLWWCRLYHGWVLGACHDGVSILSAPETSVWKDHKSIIQGYHSYTLPNWGMRMWWLQNDKRDCLGIAG